MTLTYGLNALPQTLYNHCTGHSLIVDPLDISLTDVLFVPHLQALEQETNYLLDSHLTQMYIKNAHPFVEITTRQAATAHTPPVLQLCPQMRLLWR